MAEGGDPRARSGAGWTGAARSGAGWTDAAGPDADPVDDGAEHPFAIAEPARYEAGAELGQGGMGRVVSAVDRRLRRLVALKRVAPGLRDRADARRRFAREVWITAALDHPAIVAVFDAGQHTDGALYYTMRLIRGRTLGRAIQEAGDLGGRLRLLRHFLVACEAVAYAHSQGVIHRDLKPDNILVGEFGETQVVDWGVARRLPQDRDARREPADLARREPADLAEPDLTEHDLAEPAKRDLADADLDPDPAGAAVAGASALAIGTPAYMSPEQGAGAPPDPRADVYSLGAVLHELVAGQPPYSGAGPSAVLRALQQAARPPLIQRQPGAPAELVAIAERALCVDPARRYPDARALAADVARYLDGRRVEAHRYSPLQDLARFARAHRGPLWVAGAAALLLLLLGGWALLRTRSERDRARGAEHVARQALSVADRNLARALVEQALTAQASDAQPEAEVLAAGALALAESPEARGVLAALLPSGRPILREQVELPDCPQGRPRSDGAVLCVSEGAVAVYAGRPLRPLWRRALPADSARWMDDGRTVMVANHRSQALLLSAADGAEQGALSGDLAWPVFSEAQPGRLGVQANSAWVSIAALGATALRNLQPCQGRGDLLAATADRAGQRIAAGCWDGSIAILSPAGALLQRVQTDLHGRRAGLSALGLSDDGRWLAAASLDGYLLSLELRGGQRAQRHADRGIVRTLAFSPDGARVAALGERGAVSVWDPRTWALVRYLPTDADRALVWVAPDELLTVGARLRRWGLQPGAAALSLMEARPPGLSGAELSPAGDRVALSGGDGGLRLLDLRDGREVYADRFQRGVLKGARFLRDGGLLAWAAGHPSLRRYDAALAPRETLDLGLLLRAALLPSGWLVAADFDRGILLLGPAPERRRLRINDQLHADLDQSADGRTVVLLTIDGAVWQVDDGAPPTARPLLSRAGAAAVALSGDGRTLALSGPRGIEIIDRATGVTRRHLSPAGQRTLDLSLSPDGGWLATGDYDRLARVYATGDGRLLAVLRGHQGRVASVRFSADGQRLVTASWDGSARLWGLSVLTRPAAALQAEAQAAWGLDLSAASAIPLR